MNPDAPYPFTVTHSEPNGSPWGSECQVTPDLEMMRRRLDNYQRVAMSDVRSLLDLLVVRDRQLEEAAGMIVLLADLIERVPDARIYLAGTLAEDLEALANALEPGVACPSGRTGEAGMSEEPDARL